MNESTGNFQDLDNVVNTDSAFVKIGSIPVT
jgi:hypothetical protein